jgi:hypothetical protein
VVEKVGIVQEPPMPMAYHSRPNYSLVVMYIAVAFTCLLLFLGQRVILPFFEDLTRDALLEDYQDAFEHVEHPAGTERIVLRALVVYPGAGGQGCDFFVGELRRASGQLDAILPAYAGQEAGGAPLQALLLAEGAFPAAAGNMLPQPLGDLAGWELSNSVETPDYVVFVLILGEEGSYGCR